MPSLLNQRYIRLAKTDAARQMVFGVVYEPDVLDAHGEMMTKEDVETICHRFMETDLRKAIDTNHDRVSNGSLVLESFLARKDDPDGYPEGSWVLGVKITDSALWARVEKGEINGFSWEAMVVPVEAYADVEIAPQQMGITQKTEDHTHFFLVEVDSNGRVVKGWTNEVNGHSHEIVKGTRTETVADHNHKFFLP